MNNDSDAMPLEKWGKSIQKLLIDAYTESSSILDHDSSIGTVREKVVSEILMKFLPPSLQLCSGQIIADNGEKSKQIDLIIARGDAPAFHFPGNISVCFLETVLATIEIKSMLYKEKLIEALENCKSIKDLRFGIAISSRGKNIIDDAFKWMDTIGGLEVYDKATQNPCMENALGCPEELWHVAYYVQLWLHWIKGDFANFEIYKKLEPLLQNPEFDLFVELLAYILKLPEERVLSSNGYSRAKEIKNEFFNKLYECLIENSLPPDNIVFAYGGYQNITSLVDEVKEWFGKNKEDMGWQKLPRLILNHRMVMYRTYNTYHCHEYETPVLFLITALINQLYRSQGQYKITFGVEGGIHEYFHLGKLLGATHPRNSASYKTWFIPFDNESEGFFIEQNNENEENYPNSIIEKKRHRH
jgi:hypothetical protein